MKSLQLIVLGILALFSSKVSGDYYTSIPSLNDLLEVEMFLISHFEKYMEAMEQISREAKNTIKRLETITAKAEDDTWDYYENPLNAFKIISRFVIDWKNLNKTVFDERPAQAYILKTASLVEEGYPEVTYDDLFGASKGLARLQRTYKQNTIDVAEGDLMGWIYSESFTASECYWLGRSLYGVGEYKYASEWLMQARIRLSDELEAPNSAWQVAKMTDLEVLEFLAPSMFFAGMSKVAILFNDELLAKDPNNAYGLQSKSEYSQRALEERHAKSHEDLYNTMPKASELEKLFDGVCNGDLQQTPREKRDLRCRYVHNNVPFCFIAPFKKEELNHDPQVAYYHETIYNSEIEKILNSTEDYVERSMVGTLNASGYSDIRTSQNAWLKFEEHRFLDNIAQRLKDITGLTLESAEDLQVANYGIGGHYGAHYDFAEDDDYDFENRGNRILTALIYINDVELGGATAFPYLRLAVAPIKHSTVVWYNMHESLELDYRTKHGGCPVLVGSKWICNEWFHEAHQEFTRPCGLTKDGYKSLKFKGLH